MGKIIMGLEEETEANMTLWPKVAAEIILGAYLITQPGEAMHMGASNHVTRKGQAYGGW